jgi:hypothetical protein
MGLKEVHDEVHDEGRWKRGIDLRKLFHPRAGFTDSEVTDSGSSIRRVWNDFHKCRCRPLAEGFVFMGKELLDRFPAGLRGLPQFGKSVQRGKPDGHQFMVQQGSQRWKHVLGRSIQFPKRP